MLGGRTVEAARCGTAFPSMLTQVTIRPISPGQSLGFQPMLTSIESPDGPSPTIRPSVGPASPKVDRHRAAAESAGSAPTPAAVNGMSPVASAPRVT